MKKLITWVLAVGAAGSAFAQPQVGVSISVNQPGVYGRIDIGNQPPPPLVLPQPVLVAPPHVAVPRQPIYLYVPPAHQHDWNRHCRRYNACGQPVYFVQERWVRERYEQQHGARERGRGHNGYEEHRRGRGEGYGRGRENRRDHDRRD